MLEFVKQNAVVCYLGVVVVALLATGVVQAQPVQHAGHPPQLALTDVVKVEGAAAPGGTRFDAPAHARYAGHAAQRAVAGAARGDQTPKAAKDETSPLASRAPASHVGHAAQLAHARSRG